VCQMCRQQSAVGRPRETLARSDAGPALSEERREEWQQKTAVLLRCFLGTQTDGRLRICMIYRGRSFIRLDDG